MFKRPFIEHGGRMNKFISILFFFVLSGCSSHSIQEKDGALLVSWDSNLSTGVMPPPGRKMCMQLAITDKNKQVDSDISVNDTVLKLMGITGAQSSDLIKVSNSVINKSQALNVSTERTVFLSVGGFYLCQLQLNGLPDEMVANLAEKWLLYSSGLSDSSKATLMQGLQENDKK